jgi:hypothetical protein
MAFQDACSHHRLSVTRVVRGAGDALADSTGPPIDAVGIELQQGDDAVPDAAGGLAREQLESSHKETAPAQTAQFESDRGHGKAQFHQASLAVMDSGGGRVAAARWR